jgi:hypothetical protein
LLLVAALAVALLWQTAALRFGGVASANQPNPGLEFTLHVGSCTTAGDQTVNCVVANNTPFVVSVSLDSIPYPYNSLGVMLAFDGIAAKDDQTIVWPDCAGETLVPDDGSTLGSSCSTSGLPSTFTGTVFTATFNCLADASVSIVHGPADTYLTDYYGKTSTDNGPDVINVECLTPTDTPVATETATPTTLVVIQSTPTPTQTPGPVGGIGVDATPATDTSRSAEELALAVVALAIVSSGLAAAGLRLRRRRL